MTLVPEEMARAVQASMGSAQPTSRVLSKLDESIQSILQSSGVSDKDKVVQYHEALQKYLQLQHHEARPTSIHVKMTEQPPLESIAQDAPSQSETEHTGSMREQVLKTLPVTLKHKAKLLMDHVLKKPENELWGWNTRGELVFNGRVIGGSNVIDLMYDVLKDRNMAKPMGWQYFLQVLRDANVPETLILNKDRREILQHIKLKGASATNSPKVLPQTPPIITTRSKIHAPSKKSKKPSLKWESF